MTKTLRKLAKAIAQQTIGRLPPPASRLIGKLARDGGKPVRDTRLRPWARSDANALISWLLSVRAALRKVFLSGIEGLPQPRAKQFAEQWANFCGCRYGLLLPHGTDALRIALASVLDHDGLDYGGEVIVPNLSFIASATAALDRRFGVAFVDVDPDTLLLDPKRVEEAIVPGKTKAIMAVHLFGHPADMTALGQIAQRHKLKLIEDAAQAHGAVWESGPVGSLGHVAGFSFQSYKNLACGEGGALTTNDEEVFERAYCMHNAGRPRLAGQRWEHVTLGWNCRPTEYQAALLLARFRRFTQQQETRWRNFLKLRELLEDVHCVEPVGVHLGLRKHGVHMFALRYRSERCAGLPIDDFLRVSTAEGAPLHRIYTCTMANQPVMRTLMRTHPDYIRVLPTPVADQAVNENLYIPHHVFLGPESDMRDIAAVFRKIDGHYRAERASREIAHAP
jgi:dTDP-4-amino-4,6-dideoxygalactose transaminase